MSSALKVLVIPGSVRSGSRNVRLASVARRELAKAGIETTRISLADYALPIFDGDLLAMSGVPQAALDLKRMISAHQGVLIVTPEYNASLPPLLKNAIDWVSRVEQAHERRGQVFHNRVFAIASASAGRLGGVRGLAALRLVLTACRAIVIPSQLALSFADDAYADGDNLRTEGDQEALDLMVRQLIDVSQQMMA